MERFRAFALSISIFLVVICAAAKDQPAQVVTWPQTGTPIIRFSFGKFKEIGSVGSQRTYMIDTTAENLWQKAISNANFALYLYDKDKVRIGEGWVSLTNVGPGQTVKFQTTIGTSGSPVSLSLDVRSLPAELRPAAPAKSYFYHCKFSAAGGDSQG